MCILAIVLPSIWLPVHKEIQILSPLNEFLLGWLMPLLALKLKLKLEG